MRILVNGDWRDTAAELLSGGWYFATETARILGGHGGILTAAEALSRLREQTAVRA